MKAHTSHDWKEDAKTLIHRIEDIIDEMENHLFDIENALWGDDKKAVAAIKAELKDR